MSTFESKWISDTEDFRALQHEWNELLRSSTCNTLFMTWEWLFTWWQHLAERRKLAILTIRQDGRLMAIAPMTIKPPDLRRMVPFSVMEIMGTGNVGSDYLSLIVRNGAETSFMPAITAALFKRNYAMEISATERSSRVMAMAMLGLNDLGCRTGQQAQCLCPYIDLREQTWESYMKKTHQSGKSRFDKKLRRLEKEYSLRFEQTQLESERGQNLATLIELHLQRWNGKGGSNAFDSQALRDFHQTFSAIALHNNWLRLFIMWLDDKPAAAVYGFFYNHVFYYYQAGFDPQFSQYSVGYLAIGLTVQNALIEDAIEYDLLRGEEEYKNAWATSARELLRLNIFPPTAKGRLCQRYLALRKRTKELIVEHAPDSIRERVFAQA
ncbi:MAG: GNAT family N-acetyltransferase [Pseudohongiella sp.]|uniref:GNAT family N-acetyltransferase n=1 Tax=Pseudohongiella sp. TaxID=1979412 RepID=UPI0034A0AB6B